MTVCPPSSASGWSAGWWAFVALMFAAQLGLIFWLSDPEPLRTRTPYPAPTLELAENAPEEWLRLSDPTLFALPRVESFSGAAWLRITPRRMPFFEYYEEPRWLAPTAASLVKGLAAADAPTVSRDWQVPVFTPAAALPELTRAPLTGGSQVRVEGELAGRRLLTPMELPPWPAPAPAPNELELVAPSKTQVVVDSRGIPLSAVLLQKSGLKAADDLALQRSLAARFEPLPGATAEEGPAVDPAARVRALTWGQLIFEWETVAPTNAP